MVNAAEPNFMKRIFAKTMPLSIQIKNLVIKAFILFRQN